MMAHLRLAFSVPEGVEDLRIQWGVTAYFFKQICWWIGTAFNERLSDLEKCKIAERFGQKDQTLCAKNWLAANICCKSSPIPVAMP